MKLSRAARYTRVTLRTVPRRLVIAAIIAITLGAPIAELFDTWDQTLQTGSDTEANVAVVALCIGVAFAIGTHSRMRVGVHETRRPLAFGPA